MQEEILATPQEGMNPEQSEVVEETTEENLETETPREDERTYSQSQFNQVLARAKAAESLLKKSPPAAAITKTNSLSEEDVEVKILKAQGMDVNLIGELRVVAKARNKSLLDSTTDPIFLAIKSQQEAETKATKSRLPASRGASSVKMEKNISSVNLSADDHKALWMAKRGN